MVGQLEPDGLAGGLVELEAGALREIDAGFEVELAACDVIDVRDLVVDAGEVSGPGVAALRDSVFEPDALAGRVAEDAVLIVLLADEGEGALLPLLQVRSYNGAL